MTHVESNDKGGWWKKKIGKNAEVQRHELCNNKLSFIRSVMKSRQKRKIF